VNARVSQGGVVAKQLKEGKTPEQIVEDLYIRCFSRKPTAEEKADLLKQVDAEPNKQEALDNLFWALLNAKEFVFNH
jgi:hypothetical protein